ESSELERMLVQRQTELARLKAGLVEQSRERIQAGESPEDEELTGRITAVQHALQRVQFSMQRVHNRVYRDMMRRLDIPLGDDEGWMPIDTRDANTQRARVAADIANGWLKS